MFIQCSIGFKNCCTFKEVVKSKIGNGENTVGKQQKYPRKSQKRQGKRTETPWETVGNDQETEET